MKLQEIFDQLSAGELSQLSIGGEAAGEINESNYARVLNHINLALTALYRRFNLKRRVIELEIQENQTDYLLHSKFAVSSTTSTEPVRYIKDSSADPFLDDIIKVEGVKDQLGCALTLNDAADPLSVLTPRALVLHVPLDLKAESLKVEYRANHQKILITPQFNPSDIEIELPDTHLSALLYNIASRVNNPIGMSNEFHAGNSYAAKYEMECLELEAKGLQVDFGETPNRLKKNGWA